MAYADDINALNPVAYWRLGEPSGSNADNAEGTAAYDGTYVGSPTLGVTGLVTGDADTAITTSGSNNVNFDGVLPGITSATTGAISFICRFSTGGKAGFTLTTNTSSTHQLYVLAHPNGVYYEYRRNGASQGVDYFQILSDNALSYDTTYHIVVVQDATNGANIYVNGALQPTTTQYGTPGDKWIKSLNDTLALTSVNAQLLDRPSDTYYTGTIDEVAIFNTVLTGANVTSLYNSALGQAYNNKVNAFNPIAFWRLGEAAGLTAADETTNSYDGTYVDSPVLGETSLVTGDTDTSVTFNGNDYVKAEYSFGTVKTVSFLVKPTSLVSSTQNTIVSLYGGGTTDDGTVTVSNTTTDAVYSGNSFDAFTQVTAPIAVCFARNGTKMYILGEGATIFVPDIVYEYTLSTAGDVSTASYVQSKALNLPGGGLSNGYFISITNDGTRLLYGASTYLEQYDLTTAFDISTLTFVQNSLIASASGHSLNAVNYVGEGDYLYVSGDLSPLIGFYCYSLSTPYDITTRTLISSYDPPYFGHGNTSFMSEDGTKIFSRGSGSAYSEFTLSTPYSPSTSGSKTDLTGGFTQGVVHHIWIEPSVNKIYTIDDAASDSTVYEYDASISQTGGLNFDVPMVARAYIDTLNRLTLSDGTTTVTTTATLPTGLTRHVVITDDTGSLKFYVDGVEVKSTTNDIFSGLTVSKVGIHSSYDETLPAPAATYDSVVTGLSPFSWWQLEETSGTTITDTQGVENGIISGSYTLNQTGLVGQAIDFLDTSPTITLSNYSTDHLAGAGVITVEFIFKLDTLPASGRNFRPFHAGVDNDADNQTGLAFIINSSGLRVGSRSQTADSFQSVSAVTVTTATWYHVVGVCDYANGDIYLYVNGALVASTTSATFGSTTFNPSAGAQAQIAKGLGTSTSDAIDGLIDDVVIYKSALTAQNVQDLYSSAFAVTGYPLAVQVLGPVAYWRLGESSGTTADNAEGTAAYDGTYSEDASGLTTTGLSVGDSDTAIVTNGTDESVNFDGIISELQTHTTGSVSFLANFPVGGNCRLSLANNTVSNAMFYFEIGESQVACYFRNGTNTPGTNYFQVRNTDTRTAGTTYHVVFVQDDTEGFLIYVNGTEVTTSVNIGTAANRWFDDLTSPSAPNRLNLQNLERNTNLYSQGTVDEVAIFNTALTAANVTALFNATGL